MESWHIAPQKRMQIIVVVAAFAQDEDASDDPSAEELCENRPADEYFRLTTEGDCRDVVR